jgi:hypothetical protein
MKKLILFLGFIFSLTGYAQAEFEGVKLTENTTDNSATKVVVQSANNVLNTIAKNDLIDVVIVNTTAELTAGIGNISKLYATRDNTIIYRFNGTIYVPLGGSLTSTATENFIPKVNASGNLVNSSVKDETNNLIFTKPIFRGIVSTGTPASPFYEKFIFNGIESVAESSIQFGNAFNTNSQTFIRFTTNNSVSGVINNNLVLKGDGSSEFGGAVTASPATLSNQVVVKSQLDAADSGNVKTTGTQSVSGIKNFINSATTRSNIFGQTTSDANQAVVSLTTDSTTQPALRIDPNAGSTGVLIDSGGANTTGVRIEPTQNNPTAGTMLVLSNKNATNGSPDISTPLTVLRNNVTVASISDLGVYTGANGTALNHLVTKAQTLYTNQTITANKTVTIAEFVNNNELILSVDATSGNITITLPTFTALQGYKVTVKKMDSSANSVLIQGVGGVNIDGATTLVVSGQYSKTTVGANLSQYIIL